jgi:hypothetical protein
MKDLDKLQTLLEKHYHAAIKSLESNAALIRVEKIEMDIIKLFTEKTK